MPLPHASAHLSLLSVVDTFPTLETSEQLALFSDAVEEFHRLRSTGALTRSSAFKAFSGLTKALCDRQFVKTQLTEQLPFDHLELLIIFRNGRDNQQTAGVPDLSFPRSQSPTNDGGMTDITRSFIEFLDALIAAWKEEEHARLASSELAKSSSWSPMPWSFRSQKDGIPPSPASYNCKLFMTSYEQCVLLIRRIVRRGRDCRAPHTFGRSSACRR